MVLYQVYVQVQADVSESYIHWLRNEHIREVLGVPGFIRAELLTKKADGIQMSAMSVKVHYYVKDETSLRTYLAEKAMALREKGMAAFPGQFSAQREIWWSVEEFL